MEPITTGGAARREHGRRKAALVTATVAVLGAAAAGAVGFGLSTASAADDDHLDQHLGLRRLPGPAAAGPRLELRLGQRPTGSGAS